MLVIKEKKSLVTLWLLVLSIFWSGFWMLNGFDKFLNGSFEPMMSEDVTKAVLVETETGEISHRMQPMHTVGFLGVNRNSKMGIFFSRIGLGDSSGNTFLITVGIIEILLGFLFLYVFFEILFKQYNTNYISIGLIISLFLFTIFSFGDILFGERMELWEHSTFMIVIIGSYYMYHHLINHLKEDLN